MGSVSLYKLDQQEASEIEQIRSLIQQHDDLTQSPVASPILATWSEAVRDFIKVYPQRLPTSVGGDEAS
jgi:glutamate synthase domain-containing protein 3